MGGREGQTGRKACPFYQYKLRKIKPARGPRFLSGDISRPLKTNSSRHGTLCVCACVRVHLCKLMCHRGPRLDKTFAKWRSMKAERKSKRDMIN